MTSEENQSQATENSSHTTKFKVSHLPFFGNIRLYIDLFPTKLVFSCRADAINEHQVCGSTDISSYSIAHISLLEILSLGENYQIQLESDDNTLLLYDISARLDWVFIEGQILFIRLAWNQFISELFEWLQNYRFELQKHKLSSDGNWQVGEKRFSSPNMS